VVAGGAVDVVDLGGWCAAQLLVFVDPFAAVVVALQNAEP
jgi:hypothetical protein